MSPKAAQGREVFSQGMSADEELDIMLRQHEQQSQLSRSESRLQSQGVQQAAQLPLWQAPLHALPQQGSQPLSSTSSSSCVHVGSSLPERDSLPITDGAALPGVGRSGGSGAPPTIHEHQVVASYPPGNVIPNLALQGPFREDTAQPMTDQVVGGHSS